jgi:hypothetical protein
LKEAKKFCPTVHEILLVLKLPAGKLVNAPFWLKLVKNTFPAVVMLLVSKLPSGKLVKAP